MILKMLNMYPNQDILGHFAPILAFQPLFPAERSIKRNRSCCRYLIRFFNNLLVSFHCNAQHLQSDVTSDGLLILFSFVVMISCSVPSTVCVAQQS